MIDVNVYALIHKNADKLTHHKNLKIIQFELDKIDDLKYDSGNDIDVFYHLAWQGSSGEERSNPELQFINIKWTIDCLHLAKNWCKAVCWCRQSYGKEELYDVPKIGNKPSAVSVYGTSKLSSQYMTKTIAVNIGIEHLWHYLTAYGVGHSPYRL